MRSLLRFKVNAMVQLICKLLHSDSTPYREIKKPFKRVLLEGLHPVFLALFYQTLGLCCPQSFGKLARQVFWLPRPFSNLPIPIDRNSGICG
jgi:hypothetical protein